MFFQFATSFELQLLKDTKEKQITDMSSNINQEKL